MLTKIFMILLILLGLYLLGGFVITALTFARTYKAHELSAYSTVAKWDFYKDRYERREVRFDSRGNTLIGHVYTVKNSREARKGLVVFSHGIWSGPEEYLTLITWLIDHGWDVFGYSYTAYNGSEGKWAKGLPQSMIDLDSALTFIEQDPALSQMPKFLMGHSWGAYATTAVLAFAHDVQGAAALSGFSDPVEISVAVGEKMLGKIGKTLGWVIDLFDRVLFGKDSRHTAVEGINHTEIPILLVHGKNDHFIDFDTTSIVSHKEEFTNKNVEYIFLEDKLQSGHNNYFGNRAATEYYNELMKQYHEIEAKYSKKKVPEEVKKKFYENVDLARANEPNEALYEQIGQFLDRIVK